MGAIDIDLTIEASEEAKICLNCNKIKCNASSCVRYKRKLEQLKWERLHQNEKNKNREENSKCED